MDNLHVLTKSKNNMVINSIFGKKFLHSLIYVVADKPAKNNLSCHVPLVGTKSYKTFLQWMADINVDVTRMRMYNQIDKPFEGLSGVSLNTAIKTGHIKVIALGAEAKKYLLKAGIDEFFILPHPSGRNRQLNDEKFVQKTLEQCRDYIYQGVS